MLIIPSWVNIRYMLIWFDIKQHLIYAYYWTVWNSFRCICLSEYVASITKQDKWFLWWKPNFLCYSIIQSINRIILLYMRHLGIKVCLKRMRLMMNAKFIKAETNALIVYCNIDLKYKIYMPRYIYEWKCYSRYLLYWQILT